MKGYDLIPEPQRVSIKDFVSLALQSEDHEIVPLAGDASNRKYYRVILGIRSWVLMSWEPFVDDGNYPFLSVQSHFKKNDVNVPDVIDKSPTQGLVLLEDLGDLTLERRVWENQNQQSIMPYYQQAIDELIKIHYFATNDKKGSCTAHKVAFDTEKFLWEMNYGREHFLEKLGGVTLSAKVQKELQEIFVDICTTLDKQPKRLCHRDYHSRNLMLKLNKMYVIDFQDARMGPIQYDLVSLLQDSYVHLHTETQQQALAYYFSQAEQKASAKIDRETFDFVYNIQMIQRCFKACGSFASFFNQRQDIRYLKYLNPTINRVARTLADFPKYKTFLQTLEDHNLLDRKFDITCTQ